MQYHQTCLGLVFTNTFYLKSLPVVLLTGKVHQGRKTGLLEHPVIGTLGEGVLEQQLVIEDSGFA